MCGYVSVSHCARGLYAGAWSNQHSFTYRQQRAAPSIELWVDPYAHDQRRPFHRWCARSDQHRRPGPNAWFRAGSHAHIHYWIAVHGHTRSTHASRAKRKLEIDI